MVNGLDVFARFFADDASRYVLIGGVATHLVLEQAGLPARATKDLDIVLCVEALDAHLTPVPFEQEVQSLSAILLDAAYYAFLHAHTMQLSGVNMVTGKALIPLKARAWLDLSARKAADAQAVDGRHIAKHRNDVLRLAQLLADGERIPVPPSITADVAQFVQAVQGQIGSELLGQLDIAEAPAMLLARLRACFGVVEP